MSISVMMVEIPSENFERAVKFYSEIFNTKIKEDVCNENEKMAFFKMQTETMMAISWSKNFIPSSNGVLVSIKVEDDLSKTLNKIINSGGKIVIPKTKIEAENMGYFATFLDSEGNTIGLYSDK